MAKENNHEDASRVTIEDFVSTEKLTAFVQSYLPADAEGGSTEVFTDARLRQYFQAYKLTIGDPLNWYLEALRKNGFVMRTSMRGEPAIFVRMKPQPMNLPILDDIFGADYLPPEGEEDADV